ncbi:MAG: DMT family transporter [Rhizobiaceae bacterium]|nr:DMT family transporter [Rhizobiaceae bacterium]
MQRFLLWAAPGIFVLLWSTGFIGARLGLPHAEPFSFLLVRFVLVLVILFPVAVYYVKKWPTRRQFIHSALIGMLLHVAYLGGVFFAIDRGMSAGVSALIVSLQPIIVLLLAAVFFKEKVRPATVGLFIMGLIGVGLVLGPIVGSGELSLPVSSLIASVIAVLGISLGTVYQKNFTGGVELLAGLIAQYFGATLLLGFLVYFTESMQINWTGEFLIALSWLIFVLSLGAVGLLMFLIRRDSVARTSALFFLVPGFTVVVANLMFEETMSAIQIIGLVVASAAVALVSVTSKTR